MPGRVRVPPIKTQGIKTKLVRFIQDRLDARAAARLVEPFLGSGVVAFNVAPKLVLAGETNPHIIDFYKAVRDGRVTAGIVRGFLTREGRRLAADGDHYYEVRDRFNSSPNPLDFLFLNRAGFNGLVRFNSKGGYNVPFCRKPGRFSKAYVTKISNQVAWVESLLRGNQKWVLRVADWRETVERVRGGDLLYLDPPYSGRNANYYNRWDRDDLQDLAAFLSETKCGFGLSLWYENRYRHNDDIDELFGQFMVEKYGHFYHVGSTEGLRGSVTEALITNVQPREGQTP